MHQEKKINWFYRWKVRQGPVQIWRIVLKAHLNAFRKFSHSAFELFKIGNTWRRRPNSCAISFKTTRIRRCQIFNNISGKPTYIERRRHRINLCDIDKWHIIHVTTRLNVDLNEPAGEIKIAKNVRTLRIVM